MDLLYLTLTLQLFAISGASGSGIVGGKEAKKHSRPYMVSLQKDGHHSCGGVLIKRDFVLTSAHCYHPHLSVVLGAHDITQNEHTQQRIEVKSYYRHPFQLFPGQTQYDMMLLKLKRKATLNRNVSTIKLDYEDKIEPKRKCSVAGWGKIKTNTNTPAATLMEVTVEVEKGAVCKKEWQRYYTVKHMICTRVNEGKGFCQGDSGGPLVCNKKALGIVAFNYAQDCQDPKYADVYMKIPFFIPWIEDVMNGLISPTRQ